MGGWVPVSMVISADLVTPGVPLNVVLKLRSISSRSFRWLVSSSGLISRGRRAGSVYQQGGRSISLATAERQTAEGERYR